MRNTMLRYIPMLLAGAFVVQAQTANPLSTEAKAAYTNIKNNILKAADKMPEDGYSFKATPDVRIFAQLVAHLADSQLRGCSAINGEAKQGTAASKTSKADLVAALKDAFAECDKAYDSLTDATAADMIKMGQRQASKLGSLARNTAHDNEMYGTMSVYLRLKGIVPPSSEPRN